MGRSGLPSLLADRRLPDLVYEAGGRPGTRSMVLMVEIGPDLAEILKDAIGFITLAALIWSAAYFFK